ncbi:hypothetical protein ACLOJK_038764 [Asimina triloba]
MCEWGMLINHAHDGKEHLFKEEGGISTLFQRCEQGIKGTGRSSERETTLFRGTSSEKKIREDIHGEMGFCNAPSLRNASLFTMTSTMASESTGKALEMGRDFNGFLLSALPSLQWRLCNCIDRRRQALEMGRGSAMVPEGGPTLEMGRVFNGFLLCAGFLQ